MTAKTDTPTSAAPSANRRRSEWFRNNRTRMMVIVVLIFLFGTALLGIESGDWLVTVLRSLSVAAITFLVASGLSLIFGLMDVLNLAHGELFMLGAYVGWTVYVRPDTFVDALAPLAVITAAFALVPLWRRIAKQVTWSPRTMRVVTWVLGLAGFGVVVLALTWFPFAKWNPDVYAESPITYSIALDTGIPSNITAAEFDVSPILSFLVLFVGSALVAGAIALSQVRRDPGVHTEVTARTWASAAVLLLFGVVVAIGNTAITDWFFGLSTTVMFFFAILVAAAFGAAAGAFIEVTMIRPLYARPIYQLMLTLGLAFIILELARYIWGRPEFTMPTPAAFNGTGEGCPASGVGGIFSGCRILEVGDSRIRIYNELFVPLVGLIVLVGVSLLLKRTRIGMIIRAGVQDSEMVEALGINVRRVFTMVFALGVSLAALGGVIAAPSVGLSPEMGARFLLLALIALAIGGLTSFPGAAAGALLVGLIQQFVIKYGQIGIDLPFMDEPFKPSPPLVPASAVMLMVVILLLLPNGLFGREDR
jgi:branched-chain amino acid transport system permease protein